jgi:hypothetical protein
MRLAYDADLAAAGVERPFRAEIDDRDWSEVATALATLDQQGFEDRLESMWYRTTFDLGPDPVRRVRLVFATVDGESSVWVSGRLVGNDAPNGRAARFEVFAPFTVDASRFAHPGRNVVVVRVDHTALRELSLGGIIAPVYVMTSN